MAFYKLSVACYVASSKPPLLSPPTPASLYPIATGATAAATTTSQMDSFANMDFSDLTLSGLEDARFDAATQFTTSRKARADFSADHDAPANASLE
ncbi:hypothetical protein BKA70DRAFT_1428346 [Coprinopsis sp. MPI-PUGE-AT-0042]|nr:hypothetical protein BKA70DRAFT_1428346 [Coprinopsis sp. MPI-PUGE-AT-0042]